MTIFGLSWGYLTSKPLNTFLNVVLFTLGIAIIIVLVLFSKQLEDRLTKNAENIELVVGAKGSPLQLILCNIFHIDFPTGNIDLLEAEQLSKNRQIKLAIPLALGDSYKAIRVVGTNSKYLELYNAEIGEGRMWEKDLEVLIGSRVAKSIQIGIGDHFSSQHGLDEEGYGHEESEFEVVGVLTTTGTVLDNLILCSVPSIWKVHESHDDDDDHEEGEDHDHEEGDHDHEDGDHDQGEGEEHDHDHQDHEGEGHDHEEKVEMPSLLLPGIDLQDIDSTKQITSLLVQFRSPMGAVMLPRMINQETNMQAALPAFETARLFSLVGVGVQVVQGFAYLIIFIATLSIFIALYNSLKERKYDLAIMRSMGATKGQLFRSIILEGIIITLLGAFLGTTLGHLTIEVINSFVPSTEQSGITGAVFFVEEIYILIGSIVIGLIAALIPGIQAMKSDISTILAKG